MQETTIEIKEGESQIFEDLTITNRGGGHKILRGKDGGRGGDMSFADIALQTPRMTLTEFTTMHPEKYNNPIVFDNYSIQIQEIDWNGKLIKLNVTKK